MERSKELFARAEGVLVGGVNSPVRAFRHVGGTPLFIKRAQGAYIWDEDGNKYIDYVGTWGPAILGHAHPKVVQAIKDAAENGTSFGAPCEMEVRLAEMVRGAFPSMELVRFTSSGTEAAMGAVRAARGFTGRDKIIKFDGCYHGHADYLLVKAGSGALTGGAPDSAGVPADFVKHTLVARYNDLESVREIFEAHTVVGEGLCPLPTSDGRPHLPASGVVAGGAAPPSPPGGWGGGGPPLRIISAILHA